MLIIYDYINKLKWHPSRTWEKRSLDKINKIIVHQELGNGSIEDVNTYHITPGISNHLSYLGAPHFAYHYGIEKDGVIKMANNLDDITWHTRGVNISAIGIMLVGDFSGPDHVGTSSPSTSQLMSLKNLLDLLVMTIPNIKKTGIYGHCDFGKPACPGYEIMELIEDYKS